MQIKKPKSILWFPQLNLTLPIVLAEKSKLSILSKLLCLLLILLLSPHLFSTRWSWQYFPNLSDDQNYLKFLLEVCYLAVTRIETESEFPEILWLDILFFKQAPQGWAFCAMVKRSFGKPIFQFRVPRIQVLALSILVSC